MEQRNKLRTKAKVQKALEIKEKSEEVEKQRKGKETKN